MKHYIKNRKVEKYFKNCICDSRYVYGNKISELKVIKKITYCNYTIYIIQDVVYKYELFRAQVYKNEELLNTYSDNKLDSLLLNIQSFIEHERKWKKE